MYQLFEDIKKSDRRLFIGVDFDGTIVESNYPTAGPIKKEVVNFMKMAENAGHCIIIWTARSGPDLDFAVNFLKDNNIPFHYVNENPEDPFYKQGMQGRKLHFDILIDDKAVNVVNKQFLNFIGTLFYRSVSDEVPEFSKSFVEGLLK